MNHTNCQFRDKHTVGGIVFYKHAFLVLNMSYEHLFEVFMHLYFLTTAKYTDVIYIFCDKKMKILLNLTSVDKVPFHQLWAISKCNLVLLSVFLCKLTSLKQSVTWTVPPKVSFRYYFVGCLKVLFSHKA